MRSEETAGERQRSQRKVPVCTRTAKGEREGKRTGRDGRWFHVVENSHVRTLQEIHSLVKREIEMEVDVDFGYRA